MIGCRQVDHLSHTVIGIVRQIVFDQQTSLGVPHQVDVLGSGLGFHPGDLPSKVLDGQIHVLDAAGCRIQQSDQTERPAVGVGEHRQTPRLEIFFQRFHFCRVGKRSVHDENRDFRFRGDSLRLRRRRRGLHQHRVDCSGRQGVGACREQRGRPDPAPRRSIAKSRADRRIPGTRTQGLHPGIGPIAGKARADGHP